jgi:hypothetical protein
MSGTELAVGAIAPGASACCAGGAQGCDRYSFFEEIAAMSIHDPLRSPIYESGGLIQQCPGCKWAQRGHRSELVDCPACGQRLPVQLAIAFGGMAVVYNGTNFDVYQNSGGFVSLEQNDIAEIIQFLCKHAKDVRTGDIVRDGGSPRRIPFRPLDQHVLKRWQD